MKKNTEKYFYISDISYYDEQFITLRKPIKIKKEYVDLLKAFDSRQVYFNIAVSSYVYSEILKHPNKYLKGCKIEKKEDSSKVNNN